MLFSVSCTYNMLSRGLEVLSFVEYKVHHVFFKLPVHVLFITDKKKLFKNTQLNSMMLPWFLVILLFMKY